MDLAVLLLDDADFAEEVFDVLSLVTGQLDDLSVLGVFNDGSVAVVLLQSHTILKNIALHRQYNFINAVTTNYGQSSNGHKKTHTQLRHQRDIYSNQKFSMQVTTKYWL